MNTLYDVYADVISKNKNGLFFVPAPTGMGKTKAVIDLLDNSPDQKIIYTTYFNGLAKQFYNDIGERGIHLKSNPDHIIDLIKNNTLQRSIKDSLIFNHNPEIHRNLKTRLLKVQRFLQYDKEQDYSIISDDASWIYNHIKNNYILDEDTKRLIFPIKRFLEGDEKILVASIQKLMKPSYDGDRVHSLMSFKDFIIIIDEFDFTYRWILNQISDEKELRNIFIFLEDFIDWNQRNPAVNDELASICDKFISKLKKYNIEFPERHYFISNLDRPETLNSAFHSTKDFLKRGYYLEQIPDQDNFLISNHNSGIYSNVFFRVFTSTISSLITCLKKIHDKKGESYFNFIINDIWSKHNDDSPGKIYNFLSSTTPYFFRIQPQKNNSNISKFYRGSFNFIEASKEDLLINKRVNLSYSQLISTPEKIIDQISRKNLVMGISATLQIPRNINNFDISELRKQHYFIDWTEEYKQVIKSEIERKKDLRETTISYYSLDDNHQPSYINLFKLLKNNGYLLKEDEFDKVIDIRHNRLLRFFTYFDFVATKSKSKTHLIYATTFSQLKGLFNDENELVFSKIWKELKITKHKIHFEICIQGKVLNLFFLNKNSYRFMKEDDPDYKNIFNNGNYATIVITQFASASNGLNPICFKNNSLVDFDAIAILERSYYALHNISHREEKRKEKKENFFLWAKLLFNTDISFEQYHEGLASGLTRLNKIYLESQEYPVYMAALIIQVLGRQDRKWEKTDHCEVILWKDVESIYTKFLTDPIYTSNFELKERNNFKSAHFNELDSLIIKNTSVELIKDSIKAHSIEEETFLLKEEINSLLLGLNSYRKGGDEDGWVNWLSIRQDVLIQKPPKLKNCFIKTPHFHNQKLWLDGLNVYPPNANSGQVIDYSYPYTLVSKNKNVIRHFEHYGYELEYRHSQFQNISVWHPLFFQAIVYGALGEEAIKAILFSYGVKYSNVTQRELVELADIQTGSNFIDAKLYGEKTILQLMFKGTDLIEDSISKLKTIRFYYPEARYFIVNYASSNDTLISKGFDLYGNQVPIESADIITCPGITNMHSGEERNAVLESLLYELSK
ncbi:hypothetical protein JKA74_11635 [Marivirga sp. S37H4]|uniref:Uncharacterized protein n=1 Tax=Marivirga aurantiaca TaxID=2802615 RepID=A0A935C8U5_9BACT|nr:hypothetical protein [Marivirga aurantiaca]MBK6265690.1 hypothetical protein [Marivirga aurantiaca]